MKLKIKDSNWLFSLTQSCLLKVYLLQKKTFWRQSWQSLQVPEIYWRFCFHRWPMSCSENAVKENSSLRGHHQCSTSIIITHKAPAAPCLCHLTHKQNNLFSLCSVFWGAYLLAYCVYYQRLQYFLKWFVSHLNPFSVPTGALLYQLWKKGKETLDSLGAANKWENFLSYTAGWHLM